MTYLYNIEDAQEYISAYPGMTITHPDGYPYIDIVVIDVETMPSDSVISWLDDQPAWGETELEVLHDLCHKLGVDDSPTTDEAGESTWDANELLDECREALSGSTEDEEDETMENAMWYAVMRDLEDSDWGTGSYDLDEARAKVAELREDGYADAYIAVIDMHNEADPVCVEEIHD